MQTILEREWQTIPEHAQKEVYNFFLFIKQQYVLKTKDKDTDNDNNDTILFSNHSANLVEEWKDDKEDDDSK